MTKVEEVREKTQKDLVEKLNKYGKCALIRCTGFGKTWMLSKIFEEYIIFVSYRSDKTDSKKCKYTAWFWFFE